MRKKSGTNLDELTTNQKFFLLEIRKQIDKGKKINYKQCALNVGYSLSKARNAPSILGGARRTKLLVAEMLGLDRVTLYSELAKLILQDKDKTNKNRAIHMGLRLLGDDKPDDTHDTEIRIINNIEIAD